MRAFGLTENLIPQSLRRRLRYRSGLLKREFVLILRFKHELGLIVFDQEERKAQNQGSGKADNHWR
jgi:hypothetical protein